MTNNPGPVLGRALPLVGALGTGSRDKCRYACGWACHHPVGNPSNNPTFESVVAASLSRRGLLKAGLAGAVVLSGASALSVSQARAASGQAVDDVAAQAPSDAAKLTFRPIQPTTQDALIVPRGYRSRVVVRWGDPILAGAPEFDFDAQTPEAQRGQYGYNCDYLAFFPLPWGSGGSFHGLLWSNHEYTNPELMFRGYDADNPTREQVDIELMAHGGSVVEIRRGGDGDRSFHMVGGRYNRRITAKTPMRMTGPAAGSHWLKTQRDPSGTDVRGTLNNCAGGTTPWGTVLTAEENFDQYFAYAERVDDPEVAAAHARYTLPEGESDRKWERFYPRFNLGRTPNEPFRFGYVVEIDPYDPHSTPRKHSAMGRFKHECATTSLTKDGRVAAYMGDDARFEYVYKFVSAGRFRPHDRAHNMGLLETGTLYVARFNGDGTADGEYDGTGEWMPLQYGDGPLTEANGFTSQADVLVKTRIAADLLGATKMDRPEDVERNPVTGAVYVALTNNDQRAVLDPETGLPNPGLDEANPRVGNPTGHVIEINEDRNDAGATAFTWRIFLLCGKPEDPSTYFAGYDKDKVSPIGAPDNFAFDDAGNIWIGTDGQPDAIGFNDAFHAVPVRGPERGHVKQFLSVPVGAEATGPLLTPDQKTLFVAVQHPGEDGTIDGEGQISDWPDRRGRPPRPSVASIWRSAPGDPRIGA